jgi:hypothetical protein
VLHAPAYRARYAEFLRIDFPRIPFPENAEDFETLSKLGWALIQAHLRPPSRRSGSTRPSASSRCRRGYGTSRSAAIRCWKSTLSPARGAC